MRISAVRVEFGFDVGPLVGVEYGYLKFEQVEQARIDAHEEVWSCGRQDARGGGQRRSERLDKGRLPVADPCCTPNSSGNDLEGHPDCVKIIGIKQT